MVKGSHTPVSLHFSSGHLSSLVGHVNMLWASKEGTEYSRKSTFQIQSVNLRLYHPLPFLSLPTDTDPDHHC